MYWENSLHDLPTDCSCPFLFFFTGIAKWLIIMVRAVQAQCITCGGKKLCHGGRSWQPHLFSPFRVDTKWVSRKPAASFYLIYKHRA